MPTTFYPATLGCKINQYETQALREAWLALGMVEVATAAKADVVLVNSCAVTAKAVRDVRNTVRSAHKQNPEAQIVVTGCAAQVMREELATLAGVTHVIPQDAKTQLKQWPDVPAVNDATDTAQRMSATNEPPRKPDFPDFRVASSSRARATVKVQDGCSHRCAYCIVPLARGRSRSREIGDIIDEAHSLLIAGFREITLSGVNLRQFGQDLTGKPDFWDLLQQLDHELAPEWAGSARFRLSSLEPGQLGEKALTTFETTRMFCPQLHLSLQSGSDTVLQRMGRGHYTTLPLLDFLQNLSDIWPTYGLGADILMGFPGETEKEFEETVNYIHTLPLTYAHVFPYSKRPGTAAATMPGQLDGTTKKQRAKVVRDIVAGKKTAFLQRMVEEATPLQVVLLSETTRKGVSQFYSDCLFETLPENARKRHIFGATASSRNDSELIVTPA